MKDITLLEVALIGSTPTDQTDDLMLWVAVDTGVAITADTLQQMFPSVISSVVEIPSPQSGLIEASVFFKKDAHEKAYSAFAKLAGDKILSWADRQVRKIRPATALSETTAENTASNSGRSKPLFFEATLRGFDGASDDTDDLVLWIAVDSALGMTAELMQKMYHRLFASVVPLDPSLKEEDVMNNVSAHFRTRQDIAANQQLAKIACGLLLKHDRGLSAEQLDHKYNQEGNGSHPLFDRGEWGQLAAVGQTFIGYWEWAREQVNAPPKASPESAATPPTM